MDDHPPPHFHARYNEFQAVIAIQTLEVIRGYLPGNALRLVLQWAELHRTELLDNFDELQRPNPNWHKIVPLE